MYLPSSRLPGVTRKPLLPRLRRDHFLARDLEVAWEFPFADRRLNYIEDYSGHNRRLDISAATPDLYIIGGRVGPGAADLDDGDELSDDDAVLGALPLSAEWTVQAWFFQDVQANTNTLLCWYEASTTSTLFAVYPDDNTNTTGGWRLHWQEAGPTVLLSPDEPVATSTPRYQEWHCIQIRSRSQALMDVWVNDVQTDTETTDRSSSTAGFDRLLIGEVSVGNQNFDGKIASVRMYSRALTDAEMALYYNDPWAMYYPTFDTSPLDLNPATGGSIAPLVHHYKQAAGL